MGNGKVNRNCYLNGNCFDNSETMATSGEGFVCNTVLATQIYISHIALQWKALHLHLQHLHLHRNGFELAYPVIYEAVNYT